MKMVLRKYSEIMRKLNILIITDSSSNGLHADNPEIKGTGLYKKMQYVQELDARCLKKHLFPKTILLIAQIAVKSNTIKVVDIRGNPLGKYDKAITDVFDSHNKQAFNNHNKDVGIRKALIEQDLLPVLIDQLKSLIGDYVCDNNPRYIEYRIAEEYIPEFYSE